MQDTAIPRIVFADRIGDAVLIEFDDGTRALYPAPLLYARLPEAIPVNTAEDEEEEEAESQGRP